MIKNGINSREGGKGLLRVPARASVWYTAASMISRATTFLATPIFTRVLSDSEFGIFPLYNSWLSVLGAVMTLEVSGSVLYGGFAKFKNSHAFTKSAIGALLSVYLALCIPYFIFIKQLSSISGLPIFLLIVLAIHILSEAVSSLFCTKERYFYGYRRVFFVNIIPSLISPILALLLIRATPAYGRSLGSAAASLISFAAIIIFSRKSTDKAEAKMIKYVIKSALTMLPFVISSVILSNADKLMIGHRFGSAALAKYSVAHSLGLILTFATVGLYGALKPWIMRKLASKDTASVSMMIKMLLNLFSILTVALGCVAPELFAFLAPAEYSDALGEVYILALAVLPMFLCNVFSSVLIFREKAWIYSLFTLFAAVFNIGLNAILFMRFSYTAAAFSYLISYSILAIAEWFSLGENKILKKNSMIPLLLSVGACVLLFVLRDIPAVRLTVFILLIPMLSVICRRLFSAVKES